MIEELIKNQDNEELAKQLTANPALANGKTNGGISYLLWAGYCQNKEALSIINQFKTEFDIYEAAAAGNESQLKNILAKNQSLINDPAPDGFSALGLATFFGQFTSVRMLVENGADVNLASNNALKVAPIHSACAISNMQIAQYLVQHGADVNLAQTQGVTPLHSAAHNGNLELATLLVENGANINAKMEDGTTPLNMAENDGHEHVANYLKSKS